MSKDVVHSKDMALKLRRGVGFVSPELDQATPQSLHAR